jgi:hypothetical protein
MPGVTREWFFDKQVVVYKVTQVTSTILNTWSEAVLDGLSHWSYDQPYLTLYDLTWTRVSMQYLMLNNFDILKVGVTHRGQQRIDELRLRCPQLYIRCALMLQPSMTGRITAGSANRPPHNLGIEYGIFFQRNSALNWLLKEEIAVNY